MQQLHLVGLTTDLGGLIFSARKGSKSGGFLIELDDDLLLTIADTVRRRNGSGPSAGSSSGSSSGSGGGARQSNQAASSGGSNGSPSSAGASHDTAEAARILAKASGLEARERRPASSLSPREIQARLRAGHAIDEIAADAGVDAEWIERFAPPVRAEQAQVVERAGQARLVRARHGESTEPLTGAVRLHLAERGMRLPSPAEGGEQPWSAFHVHESLWIVRLTYRARGREQVAEWEYDLRTNELQARNRLASQLAYVEAGRRLRNVPLDEVDDDALAVAIAPPARAPAARRKAKKRASASKAKPKPPKPRPKAGAARKKKVATKSSPAAKKVPASRRRSGATTSRAASTTRSTRAGTPTPRPAVRTPPARPRPQR